ncbi:MAG: hypothetical protein ABIS06_10470 [Vicinamibacterales bacterium]
MIAILIAVVSLCGAPAVQARPDFSGTWTFDQSKTMRPGPDGRVVLAAMLGDQFVARQNGKTLTLRITFNGEIVVAVYDLTGAESENISPGDIRVRSRARWQDKKLVIDSISQGVDQGKPATIETKRTIWLEDNGDLIVDRTGTPATAVTASRSVYRRVSAPRSPLPYED